MPHDPVYPFDDDRDFSDAERGFIAALVPGVVRNAAGEVVWDNDSYAFLTGEAPDTVHPSLWRQSALTARQGLFEVTQGIYQVRGLDLSNVSFVEGDTGVIVIDPLISVETAAAALGLYRAHRGERPVTGVIYTHSHADHFGTPVSVASADVLAQLPPELFFDALAIQVSGPAAWDLDFAARWVFPDHDATYRTTLRNGVFSYVRDGSGDVTLTLTVPRPALAALAAGDPGAALGAGLALDGDTTALQQVFGVLQPGDPDFNIIEP